MVRGIIYGVIALCTAAVIVLGFNLVGPVLVGQLWEVVQQSQAAKDMGFLKGARTAVKIGLGYVLALLTFSISLWWFIRQLQWDFYTGRRRP